MRLANAWLLNYIGWTRGDGGGVDPDGQARQLGPSEIAVDFALW